jgi:nucleoside-diphosphate-sugar epimerase
MNEILIWGAHSSLGAELAGQLLRAGASELHLVDEFGIDGAEAEAAALWPAGAQAHWVPADYTAADAGLSPELLAALGKRIRHVAVIGHIHDAALGDGELDYLYRQPLLVLAELLRNAPDVMLHYVSSLFIAGDRMGAFTEYDYDCGQGFRNRYEAAGYRAEGLLRELHAGRPTAIYRLPLIAGRSGTGQALAEDGALPRLAQWLAGPGRGLRYGSAEARLPVAPVDHLARFIQANILAPQPLTGTFHLTGSRLDGPALASALGQPVAKPAYRSYLRYLADRRLGRRPPAEPEAYARYFYPHAHYDDFRYRRALEFFGLDAVEASDLPQPLWSADAAAARRTEATRQAAVQKQLPGVYELEGRQRQVIQDVDTVYWDLGSGVPVLFLSGLLGPESWFGVCKRLQREARCLVLGLVGLGPSTPNHEDAFDVARQAAWLKSVLAQLQIQAPCHFVAADVAVPVIEYFRSRWPERIASVVYCNPVVQPEAARPWLPPGYRRWSGKEGLARLQRGFEAAARGMPSLLRGEGRLLHRMDRLTDARIERFRQGIWRDAAQLHRYCAFLAEGLEPVAPLPADLGLPRKLIVGCESRTATWSELATCFAPAGASSRIELIPDAGLDAYEQYPARVAAAILAFFREMGTTGVVQSVTASAVATAGVPTAANDGTETATKPRRRRRGSA